MNPASTSTSLTSSTYGITVGGSITITAQVSSGAGTPAGSITLYDNGTALVTGTLNASGVYAYTTTSFGVGNHTITATYAGNASFSGSEGGDANAYAINVGQGLVTIDIASNNNPSLSGMGVTFTATVTGATGFTPTGTVTFKKNGTAIGTATLSGGVATLTTSTLPVGTYTIGANYNGDTNYSSQNVDNTVVHQQISTLTAPVGSYNSATIHLSFTSTVTGLTPKVVTQGITGLDFTDAGTGTCNSNGTSHTYHSGDSCSVVIKFTPATPGQKFGAIEMVNGSGVVEAMALINGTGTGPQAVIWPGTMTTVAGTGNTDFTGDGGLATSADLYYPSAVTADAAGNLYIADVYNNVIRKVDAATQTISTVAGNGTSGYSGDGYAATSAELSEPEWVSVDGAGNLYIADTGNNVIRKVDAATQIITTVAGTSGVSGDCLDPSTPCGDGGPATSAQFNEPSVVVVDAPGNLYIADTGDRRIRRVDAATQTITTVAGNGTSGYSGDGGAATSAEISRVYGIVVDGTGNLYIADGGNSVVRKVDATTQTITTVVGNGTQGDIWPNHNSFPTATSVELNWPEGLAVDAAGNLYIVDSSNQQILKVDAATQTIYAIAGDKGHACSSSTDTCGRWQSFFVCIS